MPEDRMFYWVVRLADAQEAKEKAHQRQIESALTERLKEKERTTLFYPDAQPGSGMFGVPPLVCRYCDQALDPEKDDWGVLRDKTPAKRFSGFAHISCHLSEAAP